MGFRPRIWAYCAGSAVLDKPERSVAPAGHFRARDAAFQYLVNGRHIIDADDDMKRGAEIAQSVVSKWPQRSATGKDFRCVITGEHLRPLAFYIDAPSRTLYLLEYDYGHARISARRDPLMMLQANAMLPDDRAGWTIKFFIVQPRCYMTFDDLTEDSLHVSKWTCTAEGGFEHHVSMLAAAWASVVERTGDLTSGEHCSGCFHREICPALARCTDQAVDVSEESLALDLSPEAIAHHLRTLRTAADRIKARLAGLESQASYAIRNGGSIPGFTLTSSRGRQVWSLDDNSVIAVADAYGVSVAKPSLITPKQAVKAGLPEDLVASMSEVKTGDLVLKETNPSAAFED